MAKLIFAMALSLDGFVAAEDGALEPPLHVPDEALFRHFTEHERALTGSLYGRRIYELMRYWENDRPEWTPLEHDFAVAWRAHPKWVVSRSLSSVGPNATLVSTDVEGFVRGLKAQRHGDIAVAGPELAANLGEMGLIDEYRLYVRPFVLGKGKPYFAHFKPSLRFVASERVGDDTVRLRYATSK
ncbi:MAG TPA: dihydrofolate reductase family protein [Candidatus Aquilonibacter sp.]|nr:dihydrofolate reductase family protein [Candidatus Aquilonibacter sp.]